MPKNKTSQATARKNNKMTWVIVVAFVAIGVIGFLIYKNGSRAPDKQRVTCTQQEVNKNDAFYQQSVAGKDGKRYLEICAQGN